MRRITFNTKLDSVDRILNLLKEQGILINLQCLLLRQYSRKEEIE